MTALLIKRETSMCWVFGPKFRLPLVRKFLRGGPFLNVGLKPDREPERLGKFPLYIIMYHYPPVRISKGNVPSKQKTSENRDV